MSDDQLTDDQNQASVAPGTAELAARTERLEPLYDAAMTTFSGVSPRGGAPGAGHRRCAGQARAART